MKLEEIAEYPVGQNVRGAVGQAIAAMGLEPGAAYRLYTDREGGQRFFVVTDAGLCVAETKLPGSPGSRDDGTVRVEVIPWNSVRGARMWTAGFVRGVDGPALTGRIDDPELDETIEAHGDQKPLADFMLEVMRHARTTR
jgi:hypothetical protein